MSSFIKFLSVFTLILGSAYIYTGYRLAQGFGLDGVYLILFWIIIALLILMIPVSYFVSQLVQREKFQSVFSYLAFTGLGFFTILFSLVLLKDLLAFVYSLIQSFTYDLLKSFSFTAYFLKLEDQNYLSFFISIATVSVTLLLTIYGFYQTHQRLRTLSIDVPIKNLHPDLIGLKIAQISDVHIGSTIKGKFLKKVVSRINHIQPDFVAITGDLVDGPANLLKHHLLPLADIKSRYGTFYITGNHEYYSGVNAWITEIRKLGIHVLLNENRIIKHKNASITLAGVTDLKAGSILPEHRTDPLRAMFGGEKSDIKILLAHQPNSALMAADVGFDLQLSGHTHGGQYFPGNLLIYLAQRFVSGIHKYKNMLIYVSRGTGYWGPPLRIGAPSEVTKLTLVAEN